MRVVLFHRSVPAGPAIVEVAGIAGFFFGGSAVRTPRRLGHRDVA